MPWRREDHAPSVFVLFKSLSFPPAQKPERTRASARGQRPPCRPGSAGHHGRLGQAPPTTGSPPPSVSQLPSGLHQPRPRPLRAPPSSGSTSLGPRGRPKLRPPETPSAGGSAHVGLTGLGSLGPGGVAVLNEGAPGLPVSPSHLGLWFRFSAIQGTKRYL